MFFQAFSWLLYHDFCQLHYSDYFSIYFCIFLENSRPLAFGLWPSIFSAILKNLKLFQSSNSKIYLKIEEMYGAVQKSNLLSKLFKKSVIKMTRVNKRCFQLNLGWKRTSRKHFSASAFISRSRPSASTSKMALASKTLSLMSFLNLGLIEKIFYSHLFHFF